MFGSVINGRNQCLPIHLPAGSVAQSNSVTDLPATNRDMRESLTMRGGKYQMAKEPHDATGMPHGIDPLIVAEFRDLLHDALRPNLGRDRRAFI